MTTVRPLAHMEDLRRLEAEYHELMHAVPTNSAEAASIHMRLIQLREELLVASATLPPKGCFHRMRHFMCIRASVVN